MGNVTNDAIYNVLMEIKEDIGGLKSSATLHVEALKNHGERLVHLEEFAARQKGAAKTWGLVAAGAGSGVAALVEWFRR